MKVLSVLVLFALCVGVLCNCGCIKCNPHLRVRQSRGSPVTVIYRDENYCECPKNVPFTIQVPVDPAPPPSVRYLPYRVQEVVLPKQNYIEKKLDFEVQVPDPPAAPKFLDGLFAKLDRVVLPESSPCNLPRQIPRFDEFEEPSSYGCGCGTRNCQCGRRCGCGRYVDGVQVNSSVTSHDASGTKIETWSSTYHVFHKKPGSPSKNTRRKRDVRKPFGKKEVLPNQKQRFQNFLEKLKARKPSVRETSKRNTAQSPFWKVDDLRPPEVQASFVQPVERSQKWEDSQLKGVPKWWEKSDWNRGTRPTLEKWWQNEGPRDRYKRSLNVEDETMLPFYDEGDNGIMDEKPAPKPFLLELLGAPLKLFTGSEHKGANAIPKVFETSKDFITGLVGTLGKDAMHLFFPRRSKPLGRRRFARDVPEELDLDKAGNLDNQVAKFLEEPGNLEDFFREADESLESTSPQKPVKEVCLCEADESIRSTSPPEPERVKRETSNEPERVGRAIGDVFESLFGLNLKAETLDAEVHNITEPVQESNEKLRDWEAKAKSVHVQSLETAITLAQADIKQFQTRDDGKTSTILNDLSKLHSLKNELADQTPTLEKLNAIQTLREKTTSDIISELDSNPANFQPQFWIKPLIQLQKLQCAVAKISNKLAFGKIDTHTLKVLQNLRLLTNDYENNNDLHIQQLSNLAKNLKKIITEGDSVTIRREASLLWELRNVAKLQRATIEELNKKMPNVRKRKELKILFDLHKQYQEIENKQKRLMEEL